MSSRPALFLDRDGVINVDKRYLHRREDFEFVEGIFELCRLAQARGMVIVVVTNQAGIGRGYYSEDDFHALTTWMCERFVEQGVTISAVYFCPDHPEKGVGIYKRDSWDRKPNPGMLQRACAEHGLDASRSVMIGDKISDIAAADAAGVGTTIFLRGLYGEEEETCRAEPQHRIAHLREAMALLEALPVAA